MSSCRFGDFSQWSTSSMSWTTSNAGMVRSLEAWWGWSFWAGRTDRPISCLLPVRALPGGRGGRGGRGGTVLRGDLGDLPRGRGWRLGGVDAVHLRDHVVGQVPLVVTAGVLQHAAEVRGQLVGVDPVP